MAFDGFFIRKLVGEIEENILGAHINKINNIFHTLTHQNF